MSRTDDHSLTTKQAWFVAEYVKDFNATAAAIRAGYSPKTARNSGWENLRKPHIVRAMSDLPEQVSMSAREAMARLTGFARGSMAPFLRTQDGHTVIDLATEDAQDHAFFNQAMPPDQPGPGRERDPPDSRNDDRP